MTKQKSQKNKGNFRELVKTLANQNDDIRKVVLENAPQNCKWVCGDIQKEIANYFAKVTSSLNYISYYFCCVPIYTNL